MHFFGNFIHYFNNYFFVLSEGHIVPPLGDKRVHLALHEVSAEVPLHIHGDDKSLHFLSVMPCDSNTVLNNTSKNVANDVATFSCATGHRFIDGEMLHEFNCAACEKTMSTDVSTGCLREYNHVIRRLVR